jgi:hypothetical protein
VKWDKGNKHFKVRAIYRCKRGSPPRGRYVTFITYPDFFEDGIDAYELFRRVRKGKAVETFYPKSLFTMAAVGDGGDTALTLDLHKLWKRRKKK